ncbi:hypothetical protein NKI12_14320 [Mesorhizobium australicum]|uniref:Uncharacterized protein n=1 Tax=Mesorhizobium australicum TaxID=536018 RepID=A0ACC6T0C9_9HYPH
MKSKLSLSEVAREPILATFLARGERDTGTQPVIPAPRRPVLTDGAAEKVKEQVDA